MNQFSELAVSFMILYLVVASAIGCHVHNNEQTTVIIGGDYVLNYG